MMRDQEFLDGIYQKAEAAWKEEAEVKNRRPGKARIRYGGGIFRLAAVCAAAVILIPVLFLMGRSGRHSVPQPEQPAPAVYRAPLTPAAPGEGGIPAGDGKEARVISLPAPLLVEGTVTEALLDEAGWTVALRILEIYQGEASDTLTFRCPKERGFAFETGEIGLYYLEEQEDGYTLTNGDYGKYEYAGEEGGEKLYKARDGSSLTEGVLKAE